MIAFGLAISMKFGRGNVFVMMALPNLVVFAENVQHIQPLLKENASVIQAMNGMKPIYNVSSFVEKEKSILTINANADLILLELEEPANLAQVMHMLNMENVSVRQTINGMKKIGNAIHLNLPALPDQNGIKRS